MGEITDMQYGRSGKQVPFSSAASSENFCRRESRDRIQDRVTHRQRGRSLPLLTDDPQHHRKILRLRTEEAELGPRGSWICPPASNCRASVDETAHCQVPPGPGRWPKEFLWVTPGISIPPPALQSSASAGINDVTLPLHANCWGGFGDEPQTLSPLSQVVEYRFEVGLVDQDPTLRPGRPSRRPGADCPRR
jgi:hypothetical protein